MKRRLLNTSGMRLLLRIYGHEALFIVPTFLGLVSVLYLAERFAWSDGTISAANMTWIIVWASIVMCRGERIIDRVIASMSRDSAARTRHTRFTDRRGVLAAPAHRQVSPGRHGGRAGKPR